MTSKEKRIMAQYEKEVREAADRWADDPAEKCMRCTPQHYWRSNHCDRCDEVEK